MFVKMNCKFSLYFDLIPMLRVNILLHSYFIIILNLC